MHSTFLLLVRLLTVLLTGRGYPGLHCSCCNTVPAAGAACAAATAFAVVAAFVATTRASTATAFAATAAARPSHLFYGLLLPAAAVETRRRATMKLVALIVARCAGGCDSSIVFLSSAFELSSYAFYQRNTVKEACRFFARTVIPRVPPTAREVVTHEGSFAFVRRFLDSLAVVAIADEGYPPRVGFQLLQETYDRFRAAVPDAVWTAVTAESSSSQIKFKPTLTELLRRYQDPRATDQVTVALEKTESAQVEVRRTINALLRNGEDLSELVQKSEDLSLSSKQLFKSARKARKHYACCSVQ